MLLKQAYTRLFFEKPASGITVRAICEAAEVICSTFYLHFTQPNDILIELKDETIAAVSEAMRSIGTCQGKTPNARRYLLFFLRLVERTDQNFLALLVESRDPRFRRKLSDLAMTMTDSSFHLEIDPEIIGGTVPLLYQRKPGADPVCPLGTESG